MAGNDSRNFARAERINGSRRQISAVSDSQSIPISYEFGRSTAMVE
jgi:hypothetical protein